MQIASPCMQDEGKAGLGPEKFFILGEGEKSRVLLATTRYFSRVKFDQSIEDTLRKLTKPKKLNCGEWVE